ncbi:MAG: TonB-dependent receptor plug domain-containing protein [Flavobacteriaceae bacterium]|nr:TonB-dependent receptor plug domain-containing protein [Flavobacteriaceae bacterium]NNK73826.1 TonB-dependent receptor plug domain-containing protein [Flavobacteriaceae bacterium]
MKKTFFLIFFCFSQWALAQYQVTIEAFILDYETTEPIPYVNIGFVDKSIGTVSDESGAFILIYDEDRISLLDDLQISALGYETLKVDQKQLVRLLTNSNKIFLKRKPEVLDEVLLTNEKLKTIYLGNPEIDRSVIGYWKDKKALGGEIATILDIKNKNTKLNKLSFTVIENQSDSLKIRINIYDYKKGLPADKILETNIFKTIQQSDSLVEVDLEPYNIRVDKDCVIGIELVKVYGDIIEFAISGRSGKGTSFKRYVSQDKWTRSSRIRMNFGVEAGEPAKDGESVINPREKPQKITVYWDNSTLDKARDINSELEFLKEYISVLKRVDVEVIIFNAFNSEPIVFKVIDGRSDALIRTLRNTSGFGAANFNNIVQTNSFGADAVIVFTNGRSMLGKLEPKIYVPLFTVNSSPEADHYQLQQAASYADGHYINLSKIRPKEGVALALNEIEDVIEYNTDQDESALISGKIFTAAGPIQGASIQLKNTFIEAQSDIDGFFQIRANQDDILVASFLGMKTHEVQVVDPRNVAILMKPDGELLDEVYLTAERAKSDEMQTGLSKKDSKAIGYSVDMITAEEIGPQYNTLADVLNGRFPGVQVAGLNVAYNTPRFIIRGGGGSLNIVYAMFDIDGIIYGSEQSVPQVNVQNIESITILRSLTATNRYGEIGRGGAIVIRTKSLMGPEAQNRTSALVKGNDYKDEGILLLTDKPRLKPTYLKTLEQASSFEQAQDIYNALNDEPENYTIPFYLDASDYFMRWEVDFAYSVLTTIAVIADENPKALKTLAFKMEELGKFKDAQYIYERLVNLRPKQEQSYRDLARIYVENGLYSEAMDLYKRMLANAIEDVEFVGLQRTIENELMHLLSFHRSKVDYKDLPNDLRTAKFKYDLRIVFDWNDPNTEFELQFVNPQKKFFKWSHTRLSSEERMIDEVKFGYNTEEFIIDDAESGQWIINIQSLSREETKNNPSYLKYTVYQNYGLAEETKVTKVIELYEHQTKVTLDTFMYRK